MALSADSHGSRHGCSSGPGCGKDRIAEIRMPGRTIFFVVDGSGGVPG
jgi:hypothetical protein